MKRIIVFICLVFLFITGCVSGNVRNEILDALKNNNFVLSNWKKIKEEAIKEGASDIQTIVSYDYFYQDSNNGYNVVSIGNNQNNNSYIVKIYYNIEYPKTNNIYNTSSVKKLSVSKNSDTGKWIVSVL